MRNIKLTIAYDGTNYHGFQEQRGTGLRTIQETLEDCLTRLAGERIQVVGAGRTDAGVHARGQVVNFRNSKWPIPIERIPLALNGILPGDIVVLSAQDVPEEFHSRFSSKSKTYSYCIWNDRIPSPFYRLYSYFMPVPLDIKAMEKAARYLLGCHDFKCFQASGSTVNNTVRTLYQADIIKDGPLVKLVFTGDGFLYNMVRIMVGTLAQVGTGKIEPGQVLEILQACNRVKAGPTFPPQGLCMERVVY
ncbi:tRNA pseudouridine(38-40) synthase TruA [Desulfotruncus alcoholivorax]|uniref:tRNA pseudouridine(38-40) synthase TruA n=1 Tax=Desulfotruncus alcoholivorax TaxID=265477 RepID=UPI000405A9E5|nr:tRNA pseudouridine(38-40) synthase TruA [Desulfotruncus alcoholivorax]